MHSNSPRGVVPVWNASCLKGGRVCNGNVTCECARPCRPPEGARGYNERAHRVEILRTQCVEIALCEYMFALNAYLCELRLATINMWLFTCNVIPSSIRPSNTIFRRRPQCTQSAFNGVGRSRSNGIWIVIYGRTIVWRCKRICRTQFDWTRVGQRIIGQL